jgi:hypothetical protein
MAKFWKELIGGQVKNGIKLAGPRHASSKLASFSTGSPPRLPFQFIVHFDINPSITGNLIHKNDPYMLTQMVKQIDMPSMSIVAEKRPMYNKNVPVMVSKDFKPFNVVVHDDINSNWLKFWQVYYNYHFTDGRHVMANASTDVTDFNSSIHNNKLPQGEGFMGSQFNGMDIHPHDRSQFINNIHIYQLHGETVTRTTAVNPIITDVNFTQLDYAGAGTSQEINFALEYEKLMYSPVINFDYDDAGTFVKDAIEDYTKATPFNPTGDKLKGIVKNLFGITQRAGNRESDISALNNAPRDDYGSEITKLTFSEPETTGFLGNLVRNAVRKKANELTDGLLKKNNKNLSKFKI